MNYEKLLREVMQPKTEDQLKAEIVAERQKVDYNIDVLFNCLKSIGNRCKEEEYISSKELKGIILDHMAKIKS